MGGTAALLEVRYPARCSPGLQRRAHGRAWLPQAGLQRAKGRMKPKYIFVTGGVVFSPGKSGAASSIRCLLENRGFKVTLQKNDPYLNVDPGTMSPVQHGEGVLTAERAEAD